MTETKRLTITLTGRPPVNIDLEVWPILAEARDHLYDGEYDFQSFSHTRGRVVVRQHTDGRAIVYGVWSYDSAFQGAVEGSARRGLLLQPGADIPEAIRHLADEMDAARRDSGVADHFPDQYPFGRLAAECLADLPAVDI